MPEWLLPWLLAAIAIWPLVRLEKWIHRHVQGLGLLLTNDAQAAVLIYYLALLPGVVLHEFSQWVMAQALRVKIKKFRIWPEKQRGGVIRLGLVEIDKNTDIVRASLVGMIPLVTGILVISLIGGSRFDTDTLISSLATGDLTTIFAGFHTFMGAPDFWLWFYLIFAIANAMLPEEHDRINWWLLAGLVAAITVFLLLLDLGVVLNYLVEEPLARLAKWLSFAFISALLTDLFMMGLISLSEVIFSRVLNRELEYK
jgi:hypothetical protein